MRPGRGAVVLLMAGLLSACGSGASLPSSAPATRAPSTTAPPDTVPPAAPTTTDPGLLPPTTEEPPITGLPVGLAPLWTSVTTGDPAEGLAAFFPRSAYVRMKTGLLADPSSDYSTRLIAFYELDVGAYHAVLGTGALTAQLESVNADPNLAAWIPPGACENAIGYWHLPGVRLVYRDAAMVRSFAVASMISWRGAWYVVHLGPNPRPANVGTVATPAVGPGTPGPGGGC